MTRHTSSANPPGERSARPPVPLRRPVVDPRLAVVAGALDDHTALAEVLASPELAALAEANRLSPLLARAAVTAGISGPVVERWRGQLAWSASRWLIAEELLRRIGAVLGAEGIPWLVIKGGDLAFRCYPGPEYRPASDLDVLVPEALRAEALAALGRAGFAPCHEPGRFSEDFYLRDGYNYPLRAPGGSVVELHYRLWGMVPTALAGELFAHAEPLPALGPTAHRPQAEDAFILAAVHSWHTPRPRPLSQLLDLHLLAATSPSDFAVEVAATTLRHGLQLPVGLAAASAAAYFNATALASLAGRLANQLRLPEKAALARFLRGGEAALSIGHVFLATLLAGRPRRRGLRSLLRHAWPHPHIVERSTPAHLPWWRRRLTFQLHRDLHR